MKEAQKQKFVCKFCNKSCFSGKSLGGHMRCHLALIAAARKGKVKAESESNMGCEDGADDLGDCGIVDNSKNSCKVSAEQSNSSSIQVKVEEDCNMNLGNDYQDNYALRENPRKSWKSSDSKKCRGTRKENVCKECRKMFSTSRALAGHMRTHSMKGKVHSLCKKCGKGFDSMRALFGHMKSHSKRSRVSTESAADGLSELEMDYPRKKRSVIRYRVSQNISFSSANASSSANEIGEVEEVAMCLIMLSMGVRNWDRFSCPLGSTDNANSVEEMTKIAREDNECDADEADEMKKQRERLGSCISVSVNSVSEQTVSEFVSECDKKVKLEVSADELLSSSKKSRQVDVSAKIIKVSDPIQVELVNYLKMAGEINHDDSETVDSTPCRKAILAADDPNLEGKPSNILKCDDSVSEIFKDSEKKYKCRTCNMIFRSHQALGGHRNRHKIISSSSGCTTETTLLSDDKEYNDTPIEPESSVMAMADFESTKSKEHECPMCFKVFPTGQALGGHKRAHYAGFPEGRTKETAVVNQEFHDVQTILDLNLPVLTHQKARNDGVGLKVSWTGCGHEHEPLVIAN